MEIGLLTFGAMRRAEAAPCRNFTCWSEKNIPPVSEGCEKPASGQTRGENPSCPYTVDSSGGRSGILAERRKFLNTVARPRRL